MVAVSVVIPSYNSSKTIRRCLDSVLNQKTKAKYEVIVVDSSTDNTPQILKNYPVKVIRRNMQTYPGAARNIGIKAAKGNIITCTDADCVPSADWLDNICAAHKRFDVVGGPILNGNPWSYFGWSLYFPEFSQLMRKNTKLVKSIPTCNASYKKLIFSKHGYFPESLTGEDMLFSARLEGILYDGSAVVRHINRSGLFANLKRASQLGAGDADLKAKTGNGKIVVKYPILIPALLLWRFAKISFRGLSSKYFLAFLLTFPFVLLVLCFWYAGFLKTSLRHTNL
jgi:glycosyltransferase involved in cell wall biosynthesis